MKKLINEFKEFAFRGNVLDMAVGIMIGGAITNIVSSLVNDILMPVISLFTGRIDFSALKLVLGTKEHSATINYGSFLTFVLNFILMAVCIFFVLKAIVAFKKPKEENPKATRKCPYCFGEVHDEATKCMHCGSFIDIDSNKAE